MVKMGPSDQPIEAYAEDEFIYVLGGIKLISKPRRVRASQYQRAGRDAGRPKATRNTTWPTLAN